MTVLKRLFPRSLLGQMILLMGVALLIAQLVNLAFILTGQQKLSLAQNEGPAINRFVEVAGVVNATGRIVQREGEHGRWAKKIWAFSLGDETNTAGAQEDSKLAARLASGLRSADVPFTRVRAARVSGLEGLGFRSERRRERMRDRLQLILLSAELPDGRWLNGRMVVPRSDPWLVTRLALATLTLYILVLGAVLWIAARIARPIRDLTRAAERFGGRNEAPPVEPRGPSDVRKAILAFNAMSSRVMGLLEEKDRMLGAIGHDLRTPLASLRIRAEAMEPEVEREAMVRTIQEMSDTLEDILVLARTGRAREPARPIDVAALADAVAEEFHAMGKEVRFEESPRVAVEVQPNLLRRAIRNLVDNAVTYGQRARISVAAEGGGAVIHVDDDGPGIPEEAMETVTQSFARLEGSRSRETGGAGLGLAIARAVAEAHGGELRLQNRAEGGLRASLVLKGET